MLLNFMLHFQVDLAQATELLSELTSFGRKSIHQPARTMARSIKSFCTDQDVNRSLASLLLTPAEAAAMLNPLGEEVMTMNPLP